MKRNAGNISFFCLIISLSLLILTLSTQQLLVADYKNLQMEIRQQKLFYLANSLIDCMQSCLLTRKEVSESYYLEDGENQEKTKVDLNLTIKDNVTWLSSQASVGKCSINIVQGIIQPPDQENICYAYNVVAKRIVLDKTAVVEQELLAEYNVANSSKTEQSSFQQITTNFLYYNINNYALYAFLFPTLETLDLGLAKTVFFDEQGDIYYFPARKKIIGEGLFVRHGDVLIGKYSYFTERVIIITEGNIVVEEGANIAHCLLIAAGNIEIGRQVKLQGKVFAGNRITIAENSEIKDIEKAELVFKTNRYLW